MNENSLTINISQLLPVLHQLKVIFLIEADAYRKIPLLPELDKNEIPFRIKLFFFFEVLWYFGAKLYPKY